MDIPIVLCGVNTGINLLMPIGWTAKIVGEKDNTAVLECLENGDKVCFQLQLIKSESPKPLLCIGYRDRLYRGRKVEIHANGRCVRHSEVAEATVWMKFQAPMLGDFIRMTTQ